uniref:Ankyrin repeat, SAM and basic leucine zipper domain containing 1 n=1 Tax=Chelonoidis abingdonii TaxID=106734 RepID=A0A8C0ISP9_CHEAB
MPGSSRSLAVAGGGESSDSDEDRWVIGGLQDRSSDNLNKTLQLQDKDETLKKALTSGDVSMIEELLNSGVNVEFSFQFGWTPLMYAASVANVELVRILLDRGANASFDKDQYAVLMAACTARASEEQILKTVELLLSRNANPSVVCR